MEKRCSLAHTCVHAHTNARTRAHLAFRTGLGTSLMCLSPAQRTDMKAALSETSFYHNSTSNESRMRLLVLQTWLMFELHSFVRLTNMEHAARKTRPDPGSLGGLRPIAPTWRARLLVSTDVWSKMRSDHPPPLMRTLPRPPISLTSSTSLNSYCYHQIQHNQWKESEALLGSTNISLRWLNDALCLCVARYVSGSLRCWDLGLQLQSRSTDLSRRLWSVPALTSRPARAEIYNWTKAETHSVLYGSRNRGGGCCVCVCVSCVLSVTPLESRAPPAAGDSDMSGTRELKHRGGDRRVRRLQSNHQAWQLIASARHRHPGTGS